MSETFHDAFLTEADELLAQLELALLALEDDDEPELVASAFRALHTLKGSGAMFGFTALVEFVHEFEGVFDEIRNGRLELDADILTLALRSGDHVRVLLEEANRENLVHPGSLALLEELRTLRGATAPASDAVDEGGRAVEDVPSDTGARLWRLRIGPPEDTFERGQDPFPVLRELAGLGDYVVETDNERLPSLADLDPLRWYLGFDVRLRTSASEETIRDAFLFVEDEWALEIAEQSPEVGDEPVEASAPAVDEDRLAPPAPEAAVAVDAAPEAAAASGVGDVVRVPAAKLDSLMDLVGEMVILQSQLKRIAGERDDLELEGVSEALEHMVLTMRDQTLSVRMVPLTSAFQRFRRLVRDLSQRLGKPVDLVLEGEDTELDKTIIDRLVDPLVHLVRNSMDHGVESAADRVAAGKAATGTLRIAAAQVDGGVEIVIEDDGRGIDRARVLERARERGLVRAGDDLADAEILALIFEPGFSTTEGVSDLSGRGVGMDVVRTTIESLGGAIEIHSDPGRGTRIRLAIPLTLAIIEGMLVRVDRARYVLPLGSVEQCVEVEVGAEDERLASTIDLDGELVSQVDLRAWAEVRGDRPARQQVIVTQASSRRLGLVVDEVIGAQQTVIKPLGPAYTGVRGVTGATILGDGAVALILDVDAMVDRAA